MRNPMRSFAQPLFGGSRLVIFLVVAVVAVTAARWLPVSRWTLWLSVGAILVAIWHGAFDGVLAERALKPRLGARWRPSFYAVYLALGALVLLLWWKMPAIALSAFLLYSALHFGTETERELSPERLVAGLAAGFVPIAAACHWWPQQVAAIFGIMLGSQADSAPLLTTLSGRSLWPVVVVAALAALRLRGPERFTSWGLLMTELVLFRGCSPVVAFALFFCLWHTPEHLLSSSTDTSGHFQPERLAGNLRGGFALWLISVIGVSVVCVLGRHEMQRYVGVVFIALSALTVPHMVLAEVCRREQAGSSKPLERSLTSLRTAPR